MTILVAGPDDDVVIARMFRQMWLDNDVAESGIRPDWEERVVRFLSHGRDHLGLHSFLARDAGLNVGCAVCQRFAGLYPNILEDETRAYGYIWGVFVDAAARKKGLGHALTQVCVDALRESGASHVVLHAAPMGKGVYSRMGFVPNNEMRLVL